MRCISTECPYYLQCERAAIHAGNNSREQVLQLATYGSAVFSSHISEITYACGKLGNYAMFRPKATAGRNVLAGPDFDK